jgi:hypothetical protein
MVGHINKNTMRQIFTLICLFIFSGFSYSQSVDEIVKQFISTNEVQYEHIGFGSTKSKLYQDYLTLTQIADNNELIKLTNHNNAIVRCYAGWALIDRKYSRLDSIYHSFLNNDAKVTTYSIDIKGNDNISSEFYHRYWNSLDFKDKAKDSVLFKLDSLTLYNANSDWLLILRALNNRIYPKSYNKQIEFLAFEKNNRQAIFYLSNWYKADYVEKLKPTLIKYLQKTDFKNVGITPYYQVIEELLRYKDEEIEPIIVEKLRKDKHWELKRQRFINLLHDYSIYEYDLQ